MKKILITFLLVIGSMAMQSQELTWHTNMEKATAAAKKANKPLLLFFTGSDWCGWCIRLQKEVLKTPEFAAWAKENVVLVELDFPRRSPMTPEMQQQNMALQQQLEVRGYPTVWFVKPNDKNELQRLGSTGYVAGGPSKWLEGAKKIISQ